MTIDEAINILKQYVDYDNPDVPDFYTMEEAIKVIIEALKQEPCEDCISLEAVKNTMFMVQRTAFISDNEFYRTMDLLMRLPPVTPQPRTGWIPVTERLPEEVKDVLCWYEYFRYGEYDGLYQTYGIGFYWNGSWGGEVSCGKRCRVIAWMPLPSPYKAESEVIE